MKRRHIFWIGGIILLIISAVILFERYGTRFARMERALESRGEKIGAPTSVTHFPSRSEMLGCGSFREAQWFRVTWLDARLQAWERRERDRGAVVFVGDSITQRWLTLDRAFPNFKTANRGITGDTSRGVRHRFEEDVLQLDPRAVVLLCGINDLSDGTPPECLSQNIQAMANLCRSKNPKMPLIICTVLPTGFENGTNKKVRAFNESLTQWTTTNVWIADAWSAFADENGVASAHDFPDSLHPNEAGYAKLGVYLQPFVEKVLISNEP